MCTVCIAFSFRFFVYYLHKIVAMYVNINAANKYSVRRNEKHDASKSIVNANW